MLSLVIVSWEVEESVLDKQMKNMLWSKRSKSIESVVRINDSCWNIIWRAREVSKIKHPIGRWKTVC